MQQYQWFGPKNIVVTEEEQKPFSSAEIWKAHKTRHSFPRRQVFSTIQVGVQNHMVKQQTDTTMYLLKWSKFRMPTIPNAGQDVKQQKLSFIAGGNEK
jgi:hypothetical protein